MNRRQKKKMRRNFGYNSYDKVNYTRLYFILMSRDLIPISITPNRRGQYKRGSRAEYMKHIPNTPLPVGKFAAEEYNTIHKDIIYY